MSQGRQSPSPSAAQERGEASTAGLGRLLTPALTTCRATSSRGWLGCLSELPSCIALRCEGRESLFWGKE